jgi:hypothetical protein
MESLARHILVGYCGSDLNSLKLRQAIVKAISARNYLAFIKELNKLFSVVPHSLYATKGQAIVRDEEFCVLLLLTLFCSQTLDYC